MKLITAIFILLWAQTLMASEAKLPTVDMAAKALFGEDCCIVKTAEGKDVFQIYETQDFILANKRYLSFFFHAQSFDQAGTLIDCHACRSTVAVVTYALNGNKWLLVSKNQELKRMGSWGKSPTLSFRSIKISDSVLGILVPHSYKSMGITMEFEYLLLFDGKHWKASGALMTGSDNAGTCGADSGLPCYDWSGQIGVIRNSREIYPDITIERNGTDIVGNAKEASFVDDVTYRFNGKTYKLVTSKTY